MDFNFSCDWRSGFVMDPSKKQRFGYLVSFKGLDLGDYLKQDIEVYSPYNAGSPSYSGVTITDDKATVAGIIDGFSWAGGVGDPICITAYISAENALQIQSKLKGSLKTSSVTSLAWWIANFDVESKEWFEEAYPKAPTELTGQINAPGGKDYRVSVAAEPTKISPSIDVAVYHLYFEVVPAANQTADLHFASSKSTQYVKRWGLKIGTLAAAALPANS